MQTTAAQRRDAVQEPINCMRKGLPRFVVHLLWLPSELCVPPLTPAAAA